MSILGSNWYFNSDITLYFNLMFQSILSVWYTHHILLLTCNTYIIYYNKKSWTFLEYDYFGFISKSKFIGID